MISQSPTDSPQSADRLVREAVDAFHQRSGKRPDGQALTAALLQLEKSAKQSSQTIPLASLLGTWQLCFSAGKQAKLRSGQPVGSGFYIPKLAIAQITFSQDESAAASLTITNELSVGPLHVRFTGPARYPGKKNLLAFNFTHLHVQGFGLTLYQGEVGQQRAKTPFSETAIAQLPFFAFFAATDCCLAARGRGGGLAIWAKSDS